MRIFSSIGVRFDVLVAWLVASIALRNISVWIRKRMWINYELLIRNRGMMDILFTQNFTHIRLWEKPRKATFHCIFFVFLINMTILVLYFLYYYSKYVLYRTLWKECWWHRVPEKMIVYRDPHACMEKCSWWSRICPPKMTYRKWWISYGNCSPWDFWGNWTTWVWSPSHQIYEYDQLFLHCHLSRMSPRHP